MARPQWKNFISKVLQADDKASAEATSARQLVRQEILNLVPQNNDVVHVQLSIAIHIQQLLSILLNFPVVDFNVASLLKRLESNKSNSYVSCRQFAVLFECCCAADAKDSAKSELFVRKKKNIWKESKYFNVGIEKNLCHQN